MQTYDLILNEAYRLFARNGFEKTSLFRRYLSRDGNSHVSISNKDNAAESALHVLSNEFGNSSYLIMYLSC